MKLDKTNRMESKVFTDAGQALAAVAALDARSAKGGASYNRTPGSGFEADFSDKKNDSVIHVSENMLDSMISATSDERLAALLQSGRAAVADCRSYMQTRPAQTRSELPRACHLTLVSVKQFSKDADPAFKGPDVYFDGPENDPKARNHAPEPKPQ